MSKTKPEAKHTPQPLTRSTAGAIAKLVKIKLTNPYQVALLRDLLPLLQLLPTMPTSMLYLNAGNGGLKIITGALAGAYDGADSLTTNIRNVTQGHRTFLTYTTLCLALQYMDAFPALAALPFTLTQFWLTSSQLSQKDGLWTRYKDWRNGYHDIVANAIKVLPDCLTQPLDGKNDATHLKETNHPSLANLSPTQISDHSTQQAKKNITQHTHYSLQQLAQIPKHSGVYQLAQETLSRARIHLAQHMEEKNDLFGALTMLKRVKTGSPKDYWHAQQQRCKVTLTIVNTLIKHGRPFTAANYLFRLFQDSVTDPMHNDKPNPVIKMALTTQLSDFRQAFVAVNKAIGKAIQSTDKETKPPISSKMKTDFNKIHRSISQWLSPPSAQPTESSAPTSATTL